MKINTQYIECLGRYEFVPFLGMLIFLVGGALADRQKSQPKNSTTTKTKTKQLKP